MTSPDYGALARAFANPKEPFTDVPLRHRRATIISLQTSPNSATIQFVGSTTNVAGVRYPRGSAPVVGDIVEVILAGSAPFIVAILA